jgi:predicted PurR-regulated permease PerM
VPVEPAAPVGQIVETPASPRLPPWVLPATVVFWLGYLVTVLTQHLWNRLFTLLLLVLVSLFLALAIEPGVNRLARRGWRRGRATALILFGVTGGFAVFAAAIGTLVGTQIAELLQNSETYITDTVDFLNDTFGTNLDPAQVIVQFTDPDGPVQGFIRSQQDEVFRLSVQAIGVLLQVFSVLLFTFYLVADGPKMRRAICSRLRPAQQLRVLRTWDLAITKTGGYLYSRALLALLSALFHWIVFQSAGVPAPIPLALWVGFVSQFLPVVGTYLAGILPVLIAFLDSPLKALIVLAFIVVYQQIENYYFSPRITARTMELHPALAFGSAIGGAFVLGAVGAVLALPAAAMVQAIVSSWGRRHEVIDDPLTEVRWVRPINGPTPRR